MNYGRSGAAARIFFGIISIGALAACDASLAGRPKLEGPSGLDLQETVLKLTRTEENVRNVLASGSIDGRNQLVLAEVLAIDRLYYEYENALLTEGRQSGFLFSFLGAAAGLVGGSVSAAASQNYSLLSGGLSALQTSYEKEILAERTMNALIAQMRAGRAKQLRVIYSRLGATTSKYPLAAATADLEAYRQAGTLASALESISAQATQSAQIETARTQQTIQGVVVTGVERRSPGRPVDADVIQTSFNNRVSSFTSDVRNGKISNDKIAAFLNGSKTPDAEYNENFELIQKGILARTQQSEVRAEDITASDLALISSAAAATTSVSAYTAFENALK